jgi:hypothetical protein
VNHASAAAATATFQSTNTIRRFGLLNSAATYGGDQQKFGEM